MGSWRYQIRQFVPAINREALSASHNLYFPFLSERNAARGARRFVHAPEYYVQFALLYDQ